MTPLNQCDRFTVLCCNLNAHLVLKHPQISFPAPPPPPPPCESLCARCFGLCWSAVFCDTFTLSFFLCYSLYLRCLFINLNLGHISVITLTFAPQCARCMSVISSVFTQCWWVLISSSRFNLEEQKRVIRVHFCLFWVWIFCLFCI